MTGWWLYPLLGACAGVLAGLLGIGGGLVLVAALAWLLPLQGVPEDVAVVGWDNTAEAAFSAPSLTTVAPDMDELARLAITAMLRRLDEPDSPPQTIPAPYSVVRRDSTAAAHPPRGESVRSTRRSG